MSSSPSFGPHHPSSASPATLAAPRSSCATSPFAPRGFAFPFSSQPLHSDGSEENCRRIAEVLARKHGRSPLLIGVGAKDAARDFERAVEQKGVAFPPELHGLEFLSIEKEVSEFVRGGRARPWLSARFSEGGAEGAGWLSVPAFGDWDQKNGGLPDYSMDFSKIREMRKQNKKDISRLSVGNDEELINSTATGNGSSAANHHIVGSAPARAAASTEIMASNAGLL